jgi:hypothetical protein
VFVRRRCFASAVEPHESSEATSADLDALLLHLPAERREPVRAFVTELLCSCPYCGAEVRRNSSRGLDADKRLGCFACVTAVVGSCPLCRTDVTRKHKRQELPDGRIAHSNCAEQRRR